ncbi:MAG: hypothetical protein FWF44_00070 [Defluviitaleaceae bacterium]|nr:hypothetical protein [Defluviitaleaceae bacterium]
MSAVIEKLIKLDLNAPVARHTDISLNQANHDSVVFTYRIYKGGAEISYEAFSRAELVFQKPGGVNVIDGGVLSAAGITYTLCDALLDTIGLVKGYVNLYQGDIVTASLYYDFMVYSDLLDMKRIGEIYVKTIADLAGQLQAEVDAARELLSQIQGESFAAATNPVMFGTANFKANSSVGYSPQLRMYDAGSVMRAVLLLDENAKRTRLFATYTGDGVWDNKLYYNNADNYFLDSYHFPVETGTFTPYIYGAVTAGTYNYAYQTGAYAKAGNAVDLWAHIRVNDIPAAGEGGCMIGGFPFVFPAAADSVAGILWHTNTAWNGKAPVALSNAGAASVSIRDNLAAGAPLNIDGFITQGQIHMHISFKLA